MSDPAPAGVTPPPPGTPPIPVTPTSDNPAMANPGVAPGAPAPWQTAPPPGAPPAQPGAPAWGQAGYGTPPPPPAPKPPNPVIENLKRDLVGQFPTPTDAARGKLWAMLCYLPGVFIPVWLVPLVRRDNHLALFHAKQMLGFAVIQVVVWFGFGVLRVLVGMIPNKLVKAGLSWTMLAALVLFFLLFAVIGLIGAMRGQVKPLPLIGRMADRMLRGLTVVPPTVSPEPQLAYWERVAPVTARPASQAPAAASPVPPPQPAPAVPPAPPAAPTVPPPTP